MKTTSTMSKSTRIAAEDVEALLSLIKCSPETKSLLRKMIEAYGNSRQKDGESRVFRAFDCVAANLSSIDVPF